MHENTGVCSFGSHFGSNQFVMDFENSKLHMSSVKECGSSIQTQPGFMSAFSGWGAYGSDVATSTIWVNQCEHFFCQSRSIKSQGEFSSRAFGEEKRRHMLASSMPEILSDEVGNPSDLGKKRRKQTKFSDFRVKKMRISDGLSFQQNWNWKPYTTR